MGKMPMRLMAKMAMLLTGETPVLRLTFETLNHTNKESNVARKNDKTNDFKSQAAASLGLGGLVDGIQKLVEMASKLKESGQANQSGEFTVPGLGEKGRGIFGFSVRSMSGGNDQGVKVRPFGNMHKAKEGVAIEEDRDPAVDVLQEGDRIRVIAELPGVSEADIEYEVKGDILTISTKGARKYHAEVLLPQRAQKEGIQSSYNNGVLELKLAVSKGD